MGRDVMELVRGKRWKVDQVAKKPPAPPPKRPPTKPPSETKPPPTGPGSNPPKKPPIVDLDGDGIPDVR